MTKKFTLKKELLRALFDYNSFSPNEKLERLAKESIERTDNRAAHSEPLKMPAPMDLGALDALSAAGTASAGDMPPELTRK